MHVGLQDERRRVGAARGAVEGAALVGACRVRRGRQEDQGRLQGRTPGVRIPPLARTRGVAHAHTCYMHMHMHLPFVGHRAGLPTDAGTGTLVPLGPRARSASRSFSTSSKRLGCAASSSASPLPHRLHTDAAPSHHRSIASRSPAGRRPSRCTPLRSPAPVSRRPPSACRPAASSGPSRGSSTAARSRPASPPTPRASTTRSGPCRARARSRCSTSFASSPTVRGPAPGQRPLGPAAIPPPPPPRCVGRRATRAFRSLALLKAKVLAVCA